MTTPNLRSTDKQRLEDKSGKAVLFVPSESLERAKKPFQTISTVSAGAPLRGNWRALYLHPATVTDEDVERAKRAWHTHGMSANERFRAALESFANKEMK